MGYLGDDAWKALAYRDIGEMIVRDRNHPSIIIWGARLNETPNDTAFYTSTNELAHALDDSRPTAGAMAGLRLTKDYQQDVFAEDDYSSVKGPDGVKEPALQPPETGGAGRTWSARRSAPCPGPPSTTAAPIPRPSSRGRRRHTAGPRDTPEPAMTSITMVRPAG